METKEFQTEVNEAGELFADTAIDLLADLHTAQNNNDDDAEDEARRAIDEYPLSVQVRSGWYNPSDGPEKPMEFEILLGTGGPTSKIIGELDDYAQPDSARFEFQDWFKPWTAARNLSEEQNAAILEFAQQFYFGD